MPPTARARDLIATPMLPVRLAPPVALADETLPTASEIDVTIHGTFNNGEDFTRPVGRFNARQRYDGCRTTRAGNRKPGPFRDQDRSFA